MTAMLTTVDNPFDPRTEFDEWYSYDCTLARQRDRMDTCSLLARLSNTSPLLSKELNDRSIEDAIDEIVKFDPEKRYKKIAI